MADGASKNRIYRLTKDEKPEMPRFSIDFMDKSVDPHVDFFQYANGNWMKNHTIPDEKSYWGASMELAEWNRYTLGRILEDCAFGNWEMDSVRKMVGRFYISAMDTDTIEKIRFEPIKSLMARIDAIQSKQDIIILTSEFHRLGLPVLFSFESEPDDKNSEIYAFRFSQGGISLPNRDYYIEESFEDIRKSYREHISRMFVLYGLSEKEADEFSNTVFAIELEFANNSRSPVELRDPEKNYNRFENNEIENLSPGTGIRKYLELVNLSNIPYFIVGQPEYFGGLSRILDDFTVDQWKIYLKWKVLHFSSSFLHEEVEMETFDFYNRKLFGQKKPDKRWKLAVSITDMCLGEALGKLYVEQEFGEEARLKVETMVNDLKEVFAERLKALNWMTEETKDRALEKFSKFRTKIGHPSKFIDYSPIRIEEDDFLGNILRSNEFEFNREIARVNKPVDRELWYMTPPTVNAYFSPYENEIVFPAGILQPPFFDPSLDVAVNYGSMGGTIAHEITHGFDDEGRKYDARGNLNEWWTEEDAREFDTRAARVADLYNSQEVLPSLKVNGQLTLGENIADLGGVTIAFEALKRRLSREPALRKTIDGFTPEQRFFIGWSQSWKSKIRDEALKWLVSNDPHSPESVRGDLPVRVHPEFTKYFRKLSEKGNTDLEPIEIW